MQPQQPIRQLFQQHYARLPQWVAVAPGRVNLIGEHVDYCGGFVLPMAIERFTSIAAAPAPADRCAGPARARLWSAALQRTVEIPLSATAAPVPTAAADGWANYVRGVVAGFSARGVCVPAFDAVIDSTVPLGGGLSSSAALEVATATLLAAMTGHAIAPLELARLCQRAEHEYAGVPCGIMDQCASTLCQEDHLLLLDCRSLETKQVPFTRPDVVVLITNSNVRHEHSCGAYAERRAECERAAALLGVESLRAATLEQVEAAQASLGAVGYRCARHVVTEIARTVAAAAALQNNNWSALGPLMAASHASLRDDYKVSCLELDLLVELACAQPGVIGSRLTGGGFGGCTVTLVEAARAAAAAAAIALGYRLQTGRECTLFTTRPVGGARLEP